VNDIMVGFWGVLIFSFPPIFGGVAGAPRCYNPLDCDARLLRARGVTKSLKLKGSDSRWYTGTTNRLVVRLYGALCHGPGSQYL
jgi:hypothetical protein